MGGALSTRAMGQIVGVSNYTVSKDREAAGVRDLTPAPLVNTVTGEVSDDYDNEFLHGAG